MGTRWEGVLVQPTDQQLSLLPMKAMPLAASVAPAIRVTFHANQYGARAPVWGLEMSGINKNSLRLQSVPPALDRAIRTSGIRDDLAALCRESVSLALALELGECVGVADWIFHSDGLCQSASMRVAAGALELPKWSDGGSSYGQAALAGVRRTVPNVGDIEEVVAAFYWGDGRHHAWRLVDGRSSLAVPEALE